MEGHPLPRFIGRRTDPLGGGKPPPWRERLRALGNVGPLLRMVWEADARQAAAIVVLRVLRAAVPVATLAIGRLIVDEVVAGLAARSAGGEANWERLWFLVALEAVVALVGEGVARASSVMESLLGDVFGNKMSERLMAKAATLDLAHFENSDFYDKLERARQQTVNRIGLLTTLLATAQDLATLLGLAAVLVLYAPWLLALLVVAVLPSLLGETHFAALGYSLLYQWTPQRRMLDYLRLTAASDATAKEVKLFGLSEWLRERYRTLAEEYMAANRRLAIRRGLVSFLLSALGTAGYYGAYVFIVGWTVQGATAANGTLFTLGLMTFLAGSFAQGRAIIQRVLLTLSAVYEQCLYLDDLFSFLGMESSIKEGGKEVPATIKEGFVLEGVGFRYPGSEEWALRNLSCRIGAGERVALVGENGAGKTTLVKLLGRLYDPEEGRITLDGVDLRDVDPASLRRAIGVIFQDFVRYELSLRVNVAVGEIGRLDDTARVEAAARDSLADSVAAALPGGYGQVLGRRFDEGVELSGGQWQKVALARAYMRAAQVLILDEPTAALDARAEHEVFQRFSDLVAGRTAIIISHRFSTVRMADRILVLQEGAVIEEGSHEELVARGGLYAELFALQAAGYQ